MQYSRQSAVELSRVESSTVEVEVEVGAGVEVEVEVEVELN